MAEIFEFPPCGDEGAPAAGSRKELLAYLASVEEQIDQLNQQEPPGMSGEEYEAWADRHEELALFSLLKSNYPKISLTAP